MGKSWSKLKCWIKPRRKWDSPVCLLKSILLINGKTYVPTFPSAARLLFWNVEHVEVAFSQVARGEGLGVFQTSERPMALMHVKKEAKWKTSETLWVWMTERTQYLLYGHHRLHYLVSLLLCLHVQPCTLACTPYSLSYWTHWRNNLKAFPWYLFLFHVSHLDVKVHYSSFRRSWSPHGFLHFIALSLPCSPITLQLKGASVGFL